MKTIVCQRCRRESEISYDSDEDLFDEPIYCPFCGEIDSEVELLLEEELNEWDE